MQKFVLKARHIVDRLLAAFLSIARFRVSRFEMVELVPVTAVKNPPLDMKTIHAANGLHIAAIAPLKDAVTIALHHAQ